MKFSSYNPTVSPNVMRNVPVEASRDLNVYGGRSGGEMWKAFGDMAKMGLSLHKDVVDGKTMEANAEYNKLMSEGTSALMQRKEGEALNIVDDYDKLQKDVLGQVREKYGNYIGYGAGAEAFNAYTMKDDATRRERMVKYQTTQTEAFQETQFNNQLATCQNFVIGGGGTDQAIEEGYNRGLPLIESRYKNYGKEKIKEEQRILKGQLVSSALSLAVNAGDYVRMEEIVAKYSSVIDPKTLTSVIGIVNKRRNEAKDLSNAKTLVDLFGYNATPEQVFEWVKNNNPPKGGAGGNMTKEAFFNAVASQESGGNYEAENGRTGAYGKYQIMPDNWPYWSQEAGLPEGAEPTPQNQEIVARFKLGQYFDRYGAEGALVAWYAGEANGARWAEGEPDAIGEGGHYSWDAPQGNGDEPSVREYVRQALGHADISDAGEINELALSEKQRKTWDEYQKFVNLHKAQEKIIIDQTQTQMLLAAQEGGDPAAIAETAMYGQSDFVRAKIQQSLDGIQRGRARETARRARGEADQSPAAAIDFFDDKLIYMLDTGRMTIDEAREYILQSGEISQKNAQKLFTLLDNYQKGEKEFAYDWKEIKQDVRNLLGAKSDDFDGIWRLIKKSTLPAIRNYQHEHDGDQPTQQWIIDTAVEMGMNREIIKKGQGWFSSDEKESTSYAALDDKGVSSYSDNGDGTFTITLADSQGNPVSTQRISADTMLAIVRGNMPAIYYIREGE